MTYLTIPHDVDASTSFGATLPSGIADDDLGILSVQYNPSSSTPSTPTGWTIVDTIAVSASFHMRVYSRVMVSADSNDVLDFTQATIGKTSHGGIILRGADTSDITYATYDESTAMLTHTNPIASGSGQRVALSIFSTRGSVNVTSIIQPYGFTLVDDVYGSGGGATSVATAIILAPDIDGSVGGGTWTQDQTQNGAIFTFAILPLPAGAPLMWVT